jgi:hypothetical protein
LMILSHFTLSDVVIKLVDEVVDFSLLM